MRPPIDDAWVAEDPTLCPDCGLESCENPDHVPPEHRPPTAGRDREAESAEARAVHQALLVGQELERERARREARRLLDAEARGPVADPVGFRVREWLTVPDPVVTWRLDGWQPAESRVLLAAARKTGKTTCVASLVRSLLDADLWLGAATVTPITGTVAILDTEMSHGQLKRWYRDQGIAHDDRLLVFPLKGQAAALDFLDPACRARWVHRLRAEDVHYLVVDNLRPILDALGLDESHEAGRWLVGFDALLREAEIPEACLVHHMGHNGERSRGDSRLRDWPDVEWRLLRQDDDDSSPRYIAAYGRDVDIPERQLAYDRTTRHLTIVGGTRRQARTQGALEAIVAVLATTGGLSGRAIKDALADTTHGRNTIDAALVVGVQAGRLVVRDGKRNSRLYSSVPVSLSVPEPTGTLAPAVCVSQCPTPFRGDTDTLPYAPLAGDDQTHKARDTHRRPPHSKRRPRASGAARNTPRTRRQAAEEP